MKIGSFNVNSVRKRLAIVQDWLKQHQPDVLCLQETKVQDIHFPLASFTDAGYHVQYRGMKSYNGVALISREKLQDVSYGFGDGQELDEPRLIRASLNGVTIVNTYVPQGYLITSPKYAYKLEWFKRLRRYFEQNFSAAQPVVWCGDMNVAPTEIDVHHPERHQHHPCFHADARQAYQETLAWGFVDVFRQLYPDRLQYTFWDYWPGSLSGNKGWRIDHILATPSLAKKCTRIEVDVEPRKTAEPSDHTFIWAEFS